MYLEHSNDIFGVGLVQVGFRQFGYPAWLAAIDSLAGLINVEPLALTVILQRLLLIIGAMVAVYVLRWWATFIVLVLALPTMVVYSNFILTEAIGVPVAVIAAVACVALFKPSSRSVGTVALAIASVAAAVLPMIRLHYGLLSVAIVASIAIALLSDPERRRHGVLAILGIVASISVLVVSLSIENKAENDIFFPSLGSERVLFWSSWETVVSTNRDIVAEAIPEVYLGGIPDSLILAIDNSDMTFREQNAAYATAVSQIYEVTGKSLNRQRLLSFAGAIGGSRLDDIRPIVGWAALPIAATGTSSFTDQYWGVESMDPGLIAARYNDNKIAQPILSIASRVPSIRSPYLGDVIDALLAVAIIGSLLLLSYKESRPLAAIGLAVLLGYAAASSLYVMDNLRYLLPGYLFAIVLISGAARVRWGTPNDYSTSSSAISLPRS